MASVQELLLAAQAKQEESPLVGLAKVLASSYDSYQKAQDLAAERQVKQLQIEEAKQKAEQRRQDSIRQKSIRERAASTPSEKLNLKTTINSDGTMSETYEFGRTETTTMTPYQKAMIELRKREVDIKNSKETNKVTKDQSSKETAFNIYETARDGLLKGLEGTVTGPVAGKLPAFTSAQQVGEASVAAMAPVLKQLFRVAGEGTFSDKEQELLLNMIPNREMRPEARKQSIENIDRIIKAKLGVSGSSFNDTQPIESEQSSLWSDAEEEELRRLEQKFGGR